MTALDCLVISVGDFIRVEFNNSLSKTGYRIGKARVEAIRDDGALLVSYNTFWGIAIEVNKLIYKEKFESDIVASCGRSCRREDMAQYYGSPEGFFRYVGFPNFVMF